MVVLLAGSVSAAPAASTEEIHVPEVEPNDTPAQATVAGYGSLLLGSLTETDPVDYFRFTGQAGDAIALPLGDIYSPFVVTLYDASLNPVVLESDNHIATLAVDGVYYIKVTHPELYDWERYYGVGLLKLVGNEPNNSMATATPVESLSTVNATFDYPCDDDWYQFDGRAGDVFPILYWDPNAWYRVSPYQLYDADGVLLEGINVLPKDGHYYLEMFGEDSDDDDNWCLDGPYSVTIGYPLWVSSSVNGLGGNASIRDEDIAMRDDAAGKWRLVFDGSDVGITGDVTAIERLDDGSILMSFGSPQSVPNLGKVMPQDIVRFWPTSLGSTTDGWFEWYLDGSDVGLTTSGEKIDAIQMKPYAYDPNPLAISLTGSGTVPRASGGTLKVKDEDMLNFVVTQIGVDSQGAWRMDLDGSTIPGMGTEDIAAATYINLVPARFSRQLLAFTNGFKIDGVRGGPRDILDLQRNLSNPDPAVVVKNLTNKNIDAITVGVNVAP